MQNKNTFFRDLVSQSLIDEWAGNIDWLLNDNKFEKWIKNDKIKYTKLIKNYLKNNSIDYRKLKIDELKSVKLKRNNYAYISSSESECIDLIKHIRNGIAHGNCTIKKEKNKVLYLVITDYNSSKKAITAKLSIPIDTISNIRLLYKKVKQNN